MRLYRHHREHSFYSANQTLDCCLGGSLINVVVSLLLSTIIMFATVQWYQILKKTVIEERATGQYLELGRTILQYLGNDLKTAGYRGCRTQDKHFSIRRNFSHVGNFQYFRTDRVIFGLHATRAHCQGRMPSTVCERLKENSDILVIYQVPGKIFSLRENMNKTDEVIYSQRKKPIKKDAIALISDCRQGDFFVASQVEGETVFHKAGTNANFSEHLSKTYKKNAEVAELKTIAYYLGTSNRYKQKEVQTYSLFRDDLLYNAEEVIEGIVDFKVEYGLWDPKFGIHYKPATSIEEDQWEKIYGIRLKVKDQKNQSWEYQLAIRNR